MIKKRKEKRTMDKLAKVRADVEKLSGNPYYMMAVKDALAIIDSLPNEPAKDRFAFKAIPRLLDMIEPSERAKSYVTKLADAFDVEGYHTDAEIVRESLKMMNGEKVAMATMDEETVSEDLNKIAKEFADNITDKIGYKLQLRRAVYFGAQWQKEKEYTCYEEAFEDGAKWQKAKLPKWKNKPLGGGCWSGEISVDPIRRLYRYEHYIINADKLFKLLDKED